MALRPQYRAFLLELFEAFGPVSVRPMFGGAGIFAGEVMFGLVSDERVYLKTDETTRIDFDREGAQPFTFVKTKTGERIETAYLALPDRLYDERDEAAEWARRAHEVAVRKSKSKRVTGRRRPGVRSRRKRS